MKEKHYEEKIRICVYWKRGLFMDIKKEVLNQFGKHAESYVNSELHAKGNDLKLMVEISGANKDEILLDIATGGGHVANAFAPLVKKVIAYDITPEILLQARNFITKNGHLNVEFVQGDAEILPFGDHSFDFVTCRIAAHHFPNIKQFINEVYRVLKPDGYLLLIDNVAPEKEELDQFYNEIEKQRDPSHYRAWKKTEWIRFLEEKDFSIEIMIRHEKRFNFNDWYDRMQQSQELKEELQQRMIQSTVKTKKHFKIKIVENSIIEFYGESVLIKAKPM